MKSFIPRRGPSAVVVGVTVVTSVLFFALLFEWSAWWFFLVEAMAVAFFFLCGGAGEEELGWGCIGIFAVVAGMGFFISKSSITTILTRINESSSAVQAVSALVTAALAVVLFQLHRREEKRNSEAILVTSVQMLLIPNYAQTIGKTGEEISKLCNISGDIYKKYIILFKIYNISKYGIIGDVDIVETTLKRCKNIECLDKNISHCDKSLLMSGEHRIYVFIVEKDECNKNINVIFKYKYGGDPLKEVVKKWTLDFEAVGSSCEETVMSVPVHESEY